MTDSKSPSVTSLAPWTVVVGAAMVWVGSAFLILVSFGGPLTPRGSILTNIPGNGDPYIAPAFLFVDAVMQGFGVVSSVLAGLIMRRWKTASVTLTVLAVPWVILGVIDAFYGSLAFVRDAVWIVFATVLISYAPPSRLWLKRKDDREELPIGLSRP